jgi:signal transduction histidine kinase/DNA-binding response OmpR family regulator/ligand-binding sensor domain-containing protein
MATDDNYLWISTKWGLNKFSQTEHIIEEYYSEFKEDSPITRDKQGNLYVLNNQDIIYFYDKSKNKFINLALGPVNKTDSIVSFYMDSNDTIRITRNGIMERYTVDLHEQPYPVITRHPDFEHPYPIISVFENKGNLFFCDKNGDLYVISSDNLHFITNITPLLNKNGDISTIIYDGNDILIGFLMNGLVRLNSQQNYQAEKIDIDCGIFSLWKDDRQDILWIGTDGQGVFLYTKDDYIFKGINLKELPIKKERPVRAIHTDHLNNLWLGTKDNGIIRIKEYDSVFDDSPKNIKHFTVNDGLSNNAVFSFVQSAANNILWIGSDGPNLNYYSYYDKKIHTLTNHTTTQIVKVHALLESSDSLLWVASGNSLLRISIEKEGNVFATNAVKSYTFDIKNKQSYNQIFSLYNENDSIIWAGVRGNGVIRFNVQTKDYNLITFDKNGVAPANDILCIYQDKNKTFWFGSSYGIIRFNILPDGNYEYKNYNENDGLINNTIHGILEDDEGKLWLSTNKGIVLFDPVNESVRSFNQKTGLKTIEFSDNSYFKDKQKSIYFFGGVDGLIWIKHDQNKKKQFIPDIFFTKLRIFNEDHNINRFVKKAGNESYIELNHKQNFFTLSFIAMDFINGGNNSYSYKLENFNNVWMNTRLNEANFTNISPGDYVLSVKYNAGSDDPGEGLVQSIRIKILSPWYMTLYAKLIYFLALLGVMYLIFLFAKQKYEQKKIKIAQKLDLKYKEEMYEGKLRFFTNITHELSTPLTLIHGPSERILNYEGSDSFIKKYAQIIKSNTERLNSLIQEIIDFRRIETGNKICRIQNIDISEIVLEISESYTELSEQNNINFETIVDPHLMWNTDSGCFTKILNNLISNAFKYTSTKGYVKVSVAVEDNILILRVYNTGKGIDKDDIPVIFNRYSILDNIKENSIKGLSSRNGLGLAICQNMTELLGGTIEVESELDKFAEFIVKLPYLETTANQLEPVIPNYPDKPVIIKKEKANYPENRNKNRILVIDDNEELLWMIKEILSDEYNVLIAMDGQKGLVMLKESTPDLIITDILMPNLDGISLTKQIKQNRHTMHIPVIILSAKTSINERIEGVESGADAYIPKPFDAQYLKTVIKHLIENKKMLGEYYNSSASAYNFSNGQLLKKEDKDFFQAVVQMIDKNIDNVHFSPENLAENLGISIRNLYRKFKDLGQRPPKDFIKNQRVIHAAKLLLTTDLTIQEVMFSTGFTNRTHFYKEFAKQFTQSPKEYRDSNKLKDESL